MGWQRHPAIDGWAKRLDAISLDIKAFEDYCQHVHLEAWVDTPAGRLGWAKAEPDRFRVVLAWDGERRALIECKVEQRVTAAASLPALLQAIAARTEGAPNT